MIVVDRASPISVAEAREIASQIGGEVLGIAGYSGGPSALSPWPTTAFRPLREAGFWIASFWVGSQFGGDFSAQTAQYQGARATTDADMRGVLDCPLVLDVEAGTWASVDHAVVLEYVDNWCAAVLAHGGHPWLYGVGELINAAAGQVGWQGFWPASWTQNSWQPVPGFSAPIHGLPVAVQYCHDQIMAQGVAAVDVSVVDPALLTQEDIPLTPQEKDDLASAWVQVLYPALLGAPSTSDQAGADYWFAQFVANDFGHTMGAFVAAAQQDARYIPARVAKLEAEYGSVAAPDASLGARLTALEGIVTAVKAAL